MTWPTEGNSRRAQPCPSAVGRQPSDSPDRNQPPTQHRETSLVAASRSHVPGVWSMVTRVAGGAWRALQLCHRYVVVPAAVWVLRNLREYIEEQLAIQKALRRPCPVPKYSEDEIRQATDDLSFTRRALGTPYGMVAYLTRLRGRDVAVTQVHLAKVADVDAFWEEAAAGRALLDTNTNSTPTGTHVVPYSGCCPVLACHVYEQRPYTCSLREALPAASPYSGALSGWDSRVALCQQLVAAVVHLIQAGVYARELSASHVLVNLDGTGIPYSGGAGGGSGGDDAVSNGAPQCWLAPGCGFQTLAPVRTQLPRAQPPNPMPPGQGQGGPMGNLTAPGGRGQAQQQEADVEVALTRVSAMARGLGQVLMQVLAGVDCPTPAPSAVMKALAEVSPCRLLAPTVAPPLTDDQTWPMLASIYPLLVWGGDGAAEAEAPGPALVPRDPEQPPGMVPGAGPMWPMRTSGRNGSGAGGIAGRGRSGGAAALRAHLVEDVAPALAEMQRQLRRTAAARRRPPPPAAPQRAAAAATQADVGVRATAAAAGGGVTSAAAATPEEDAFVGASAPPLPVYPLMQMASAPPAAAAAQPSWLPPGTPPPAPHAPYPQHAQYLQQQRHVSHDTQAPMDPTSSAAAAGIDGVAGLQAGVGCSRPGAARRWAAGPPEDFLCPITQDLMDDPVVAADGHSYERAAIARWFAGKPGRPTSPLTGAALSHTSLTPNYALRKIIRDWREQHGAERGS